MGSFDFGSITSIFSAAPVDWIIIAGIVAIGALDSLRSGTRRATAAALSAPLTLFVWTALSDARFVSDITAQFESPGMEAILVGAIFVGLSILVYRMLDNARMTGSFPLPAILSGLAAAILVVIVWLHIPPLQAVWSIDNRVESLFADAYVFWWAIGSLCALAYARS